MAEAATIGVVGSVSFIDALDVPGLLQLANNAAEVVGTGATDMPFDSFVDHLLGFEQIVWQLTFELLADAGFESLATLASA